MIKYQIWYMKPSFLRGVVGSSPDLGVFTQSGSKVDLTPQKCDFGSSPMCGLRVGKDFLHVLQHWSVQPCVRPLGAVHMTAGHNALRGSGPDQTPAFDNASTQVRTDELTPRHRRHVPLGMRAEMMLARRRPYFGRHSTLKAMMICAGSALPMKCSRLIRAIVSTISIPNHLLRYKAGSATDQSVGGQFWTPIPRLRGVNIAGRMIRITALFLSSLPYGRKQGNGGTRKTLGTDSKLRLRSRPARLGGSFSWRLLNAHPLRA